jgi:hypothetical protein
MVLYINILTFELRREKDGEENHRSEVQERPELLKPIFSQGQVTSSLLLPQFNYNTHKLESIASLYLQIQTQENSS